MAKENRPYLIVNYDLFKIAEQELIDVTALLLFVLIANLQKTKYGCRVDNSYFESTLYKSSSTIKRKLKDLSDKNWIEISGKTTKRNIKLTQKGKEIFAGKYSNVTEILQTRVNSAPRYNPTRVKSASTKVKSAPKKVNLTLTRVKNEQTRVKSAQKKPCNDCNQRARTLLINKNKYRINNIINNNKYNKKFLKEKIFRPYKKNKIESSKKSKEKTNKIKNSNNYTMKDNWLNITTKDITKAKTTLNRLSEYITELSNKNNLEETININELLHYAMDKYDITLTEDFNGLYCLNVLYKRIREHENDTLNWLYMNNPQKQKEPDFSEMVRNLNIF